MKDLNKLAGQTLVYGLGTMLPRFLNYALLTPFYVRVFEQSDYGVVTELYAYMAFFLVLLTYGMETGFFRFAQKSDKPDVVFSTTMTSLLISSLLFVVLFNVFINPVSVFMKYEDSQIFLKMFSWIVTLDAITAIPFAKLRRENKALKFSLIKLVNVLVIIALALFFYKVAPIIDYQEDSLMARIYNPDFGVGYVFVANLAGSIVMFLLVLPQIFSVKLKFSFSLWRDMIIYSFPLLISGMAGIINDALDKVIIRRVVESDDPLSVVGVYGASYKIAVLMALFIQMYRFAMEPFFFDKASEKDAKETYSGAMKYFVIYALLLFLGLNLYISVIQLILPGDYRGSMFIVPIVSMGYLLFGIFVNLSIWYKVNDKTKYGAYLTFLGAIITIAINLLFVPKVGVIASAWAHIACYAVMVIASYLLSRKHYPIDYEIGKILSYIALSIAIVMVVKRIEYSSLLREVGFNTLFIIGYILIAEYKDKIVSVFIKRNK